jgi:hypothetical protein
LTKCAGYGRLTVRERGAFLSSAIGYTKERCLLKNSQLSPVGPGKSNVYMRMGMERWWNGMDRGNPKWDNNIRTRYSTVLSSLCVSFTINYTHNAQQDATLVS